MEPKARNIRIGFVADCSLYYWVDGCWTGFWIQLADSLYCSVRFCFNFNRYCNAVAWGSRRYYPTTRTKDCCHTFVRRFTDSAIIGISCFIAPNHVVESTSVRFQNIGLGLIAVAGLIAAGYWLLNPLFRLLAAAKAREVMTAAALLVVLGAALLMQVSGLSMAMGAFLAGVLLSESTFRHQIEADIEPFRGILLGLFFLGVGMSLDLSVVAKSWPLIISGVLSLMLMKAVVIYIVARLTKSPHGEALDRALLMAQGGEFAFVLLRQLLLLKLSILQSNQT